MLLGTDGGIGQMLLHPSRKVSKLYKVGWHSALILLAATLMSPRLRDQVGLVEREGRPLIASDAVQRFSEGVELASGERCLPATLTLGPIEPGQPVPLGISGGEPVTRDLDGGGSYCGGLEAHEVLVAVEEGRYHQVKRMVAACGGHVATLHRLALGRLQLDDTLRPGEARELSDREIDVLHGMLPVDRSPITAPPRPGAGSERPTSPPATTARTSACTP